MTIYFGDNKRLKFKLGSGKYNLTLGKDESIVSLIRLLSADGYILKDKNGVYLLPAKEEVVQ